MQKKLKIPLTQDIMASNTLDSKKRHLMLFTSLRLTASLHL